MRFHIAVIFAFAATTHFAAAAPVQWNGKDMETAYKTGSRVCGAVGYACRQTGHTTTGNAFFGAAAGFSAAEVAVTGSGGKSIPQAATAVGNTAKSVGNSIVKGGTTAAKCVGDLCKTAYNAVTGGSAAPKQTDLEQGPPEQGQSSNQQGETSSQQGESSSQQGETSSQQGKPSSQQGETSSQQGKSSSQQGQSSSQQGETSSQQGQSSSKQGKSSSRRRAIETRDETDALLARYAEPEPEARLDEKLVDIEE